MTLRSSLSNSSQVVSVNQEKMQSNRIKKLSPLLVNQLAAGEVVTRPASVVKELIENAIDAGATVIDVRITQGGMAMIEVSDNGCGIHPDDMAMAVTRYATSKIADVAQLQGVSTLGFRGEALAATAAVSRLTLTSAHDDSGIGRQLSIAGILEDSPKLTPVVRPQGTTITVKDLYFNVPARRGNLKSISTEFTYVEAVVKQLALVASNIEISLWHNDKRRFQFQAVTAVDGAVDEHSVLMSHILARLNSIFPNLKLPRVMPLNDALTHKLTDSSKNEALLLPLYLPLNGLLEQSQNSDDSEAIDDNQQIGAYGFLMPFVSFSSNAPLSQPPKLIYVNGRLVKDRYIAQSLRSGASKLPDTYELGHVLFLELPQSWLNVNVHPEKQCIKVHNMLNISVHLTVGVRSLLQSLVNTLPTALAIETKSDTSEGTNAYDRQNDLLSTADSGQSSWQTKSYQQRPSKRPIAPSFRDDPNITNRYQQSSSLNQHSPNWDSLNRDSLDRDSLDRDSTHRQGDKSMAYPENTQAHNGLLNVNEIMQGYQFTQEAVALSNSQHQSSLPSQRLVSSKSIPTKLIPDSINTEQVAHCLTVIKAPTLTEDVLMTDKATDECDECEDVITIADVCNRWALIEAKGKLLLIKLSDVLHIINQQAYLDSDNEKFASTDAEYNLQVDINLIQRQAEQIDFNDTIAVLTLCQLVNQALTNYIDTFNSTKFLQLLTDKASKQCSTTQVATRMLSNY